ncbi:sarcosine oxidase subunit beta [Halarchaeum rubridurum]|uniref:Sarcosine oxidase n=1 Tax=Halarchaeum rubridurum TaxID=489911 RepID=A0A830FZT7_9EURY|nr:FAD-dependent oxidoreductase [Halarchaeum rubridurum]MBP1955184.1 sarcosine oxidase subunit beta [Halarchaeum rubridurum]GGM68275.1 sarcosine oxidase [Halarchaeum rubridurum]
MTARSVAVVGGGAVGLTAAYDLARRDADVTLYERDALGAGSTARAAGIAYDAYAEDVDVALAERAIERFRAFSGERDFRFAHAPYLWFVTEGGAAAGAIREQVERMHHHDRDVELVESDAIRRRFPVLRADDVVAAGLARTAGTVDPEGYVDLLAAKAREAGATLRTDAPAAVALDPPRVNGTAYDAVVVAAGAWTGEVLADAGVSVPLEPYRVQAAVTGGPAIPILYDATRDYYARPHPQGVIAGDGVTTPADPDDYDRDADDDFRDRLTDRLRDRVVNARVPVRRSWAGVCARTPDNDPLLGELADGLYVGAGWNGHGLMRAPAAGERLAEDVLGERDGVGAFDPTRF